MAISEPAESHLHQKNESQQAFAYDDVPKNIVLDKAPKSDIEPKINCNKNPRSMLDISALEKYLDQSGDLVSLD